MVATQVKELSIDRVVSVAMRIGMMEPGETLSYYLCDDVVLDIRIEAQNDARVWDSVWINGRHCGNRHGGCRAIEWVCNILSEGGYRITTSEPYHDDVYAVPLKPSPSASDWILGDTRSIRRR